MNLNGIHMEIIIMIIFIIGIILFPFLHEVSKDRKDLYDQTLDEKFKTIVNVLNKSVFDLKGKVTRVNKREFNLFYSGLCYQRIYFFYSTGHLTIIWKFKYFQMEVVHERVFYDVRHTNADTQQRIGEVMIKEMIQVVENHKLKVLSGLFGNYWDNKYVPESFKDECIETFNRNINYFKKPEKQIVNTPPLDSFQNSFTENQKKAIMCWIWGIANCDGEFTKLEGESFLSTAATLGYKLQNNYLDEFLTLNPETIIRLLNELDEGQKDWLIIALDVIAHADNKNLNIKEQYVSGMVTSIGITPQRFQNTIHKAMIMFDRINRTR